MSLVYIWGESLPSPGDGLVQTPEVGVCLISSSSIKEASVGGIEGTNGENGRREVQRGYGGQIMDFSIY